MASASPQPEFSDADQPSKTTAGHTAVYWVLAGGLVLAGIVATWMSLLLPSDQQTAKIVSTVLGTLLLTLSGGVISYVLTRVVTVSDVEQRYMGVLERIARSLAHVHANLQEATAQRRQGAYQHEETYQEVVLSAASAVLTEFDSITRLSGPIKGAFQRSKQDLDEVRSVFGPGGAVVETLVAAKLSVTAPTVDPVTVSCPNCGSRVGGRLAMRPGWTARVVCNHCGISFNIHRRADLSVYASWQRVQVLPVATPEKEPVRSPSLHILPAQGSDSGEVQPRELTVTCPSCKASYGFHYRPDQVVNGTDVERVCTRCACLYRVNVHSGVIGDWSPGEVLGGVITGRRASNAILACPVDGHGIVASFAMHDGQWHALCPVHKKVVGVTRQQIREWLKANDPDFLERRLAHERAGGAKVISGS